jgi:hypothetical protein
MRVRHKRQAEAEIAPYESSGKALTPYFTPLANHGSHSPLSAIARRWR